MKKTILLNLIFVIIGFTISQTVYWFRLGEGQIGTISESKEITPKEAKDVAYRMGIVWYADKVYSVEKNYSTIKKRDNFPFTKIEVDSSSLTTYLYQN